LIFKDICVYIKMDTFESKKTDFFTKILNTKYNNEIILYEDGLDLPRLKYIYNNANLLNVKTAYFKGSRLCKMKTLEFIHDFYYRKVSKKPVSYTNKCSYGGRKIARDNLSLQNLTKQIRNTIFRKSYIDLDMKSAHIVIFKRISQEFLINIPNTIEYLNNYEHYLQKIVEGMNFPCANALEKDESRERAKRIFLELLNGGSWASQVKDDPMFISRLKNCFPLIFKIESEVKQVNKKVNSRFPHLVEIAKKANEESGRCNISGTCLNYLLCICENALLMEMYNFLTLRGFEIGVLSFDGLAIRRNEKYPDLKEMANYIQTILDIDVKIVEKNHDNCVYHIPDNLLSNRIGLTCDDFSADKIINSENIGDFYDINSEYVFVRSNMRTFKTQNMKNCFNNSKVLIVVFRTTLAKDFYREFENYGFENYLDFEGGVIKGNRIIVQLDSLYKVQGDFDTLILDECTYTLLHLTEFANLNKRPVFSSLMSYLKFCKKVYFLDALLSNDFIDTVKSLVNRPSFVLDNKYESYKDYTIKFLENGLTQKKIISDLKQGLKVVLVSGSKKYIEAIGERIKTELGPDFKQLLIHSKSDVKVNTSDWIQYNFLAYSPTICAGNSFNPIHFDKLYAYFTNNSISADIGFQMLGRIRNIGDKIFNIEIKTKDDIFNDINTPLSTDGIKNMFLSHTKSVDSVLIDNFHSTLIEDEYLTLKIHNTKKIHKSRRNFFGELLKGINLHGFKVENNTTAPPKDVVEEEKKIVQDYTGKVEDENISKIVSARNISNEEYEKLKDIRDKTLEDTYAIEKKRITRVFDDIELSIDTYKNIDKSAHLLELEIIQLELEKECKKRNIEIVKRIDNKIQKILEKIDCAVNKKRLTIDSLVQPAKNLHFYISRTDSEIKDYIDTININTKIEFTEHKDSISQIEVSNRHTLPYLIYQGLIAYGFTQGFNTKGRVDTNFDSLHIFLKSKKDTIKAIIPSFDIENLKNEAQGIQVKHYILTQFSKILLSFFRFRFITHKSKNGHNDSKELQITDDFANIGHDIFKDRRIHNNQFPIRNVIEGLQMIEERYLLDDYDIL
jgi:hypothetical protein